MVRTISQISWLCRKSHSSARKNHDRNHVGYLLGNLLNRHSVRAICQDYDHSGWHFRLSLAKGTELRPKADIQYMSYPHIEQGWSCHQIALTPWPPQHSAHNPGFNLWTRNRLQCTLHCYISDVLCSSYTWALVHSSFCTLCPQIIGPSEVLIELAVEQLVTVRDHPPIYHPFLLKVIHKTKRLRYCTCIHSSMYCLKTWAYLWLA